MTALIFAGSLYAFYCSPVPADIRPDKSLTCVCMQVIAMKAEYYPPGEDLIVHNESPSEFYIMVSGSVVSIRHTVVSLQGIFTISSVSALCT
jgi:hypothetical protein